MQMSRMPRNLTAIQALAEHASPSARERVLNFGPGVLVGYRVRQTAPTGFTMEGPPPLPADALDTSLTDEMLVWRLLKLSADAPVPGTVLIGRSSDNDVVLPHSQVSNFHARLSFIDGHAFVMDSGSSNGTRVNDRTLLPGIRCMLKDADAIVFGSVGVRFYTTATFLDLITPG